VGKDVGGNGPAPSSSSTAPERPALVLAALIAVAAVANLGLAVANVALPDIGLHFDASQTALNLVAIAYSLGLAASVLYFGAVGDRYGRKMLLIIGMVVSIPASLVAAFAPSIEILILARIVGGVAAGMAYPTTLALITALWSGPARTRSIALWAATGGGITALGPVLSGLLLGEFDWGSPFLLTLPLAVIALLMALKLVPAHVNETTEPVDNLGGVLSIFMVGALILAINFVVVPSAEAAAIGLFLVAAAALVAFVVRQRHAPNPLYDLHVAARSTFWVAAVAGIIVFGSLMGAMYIGQQFLQNVLDYSAVGAGAAILPAAVFMVLVAPRSAKLVESHGSRATLLLGYVFVLLGFTTMLLLWKQGIPYWKVALGYIFVGIGVGLAGTPASHSLTGSVPVRRVGMASGTADLQRDLGGAILQSIMGVFLTAGYASAAGAAVQASGKNVSNKVESELTKSFASAADTAQQYPSSVQDGIIAAAQSSFLQGDQWAYLAGIVAVLLGAVLVFVVFPKHDAEQRALAGYAAEDASEATPDRSNVEPDGEADAPPPAEASSPDSAPDAGSSHHQSE
jgi:MFS transporter, DHA2 family, multidrug resistance protein